MVTKEEARRFLGDVAPEQCFWFINGPILINLDDLANALPNISNESYAHHVDKKKNDFGKWVDEVVGDKKLAHDLQKSKNKESAVKKARARLDSLKKKAK